MAYGIDVGGEQGYRKAPKKKKKRRRPAPMRATPEMQEMLSKAFTKGKPRLGLGQ